MFLGDDLVKARFLRRVNRFLATVELNGREAAVHVANSGRLRELFLPGALIWLKPAHREGRKTAYDLALVEAEGTLVSADARLPNALVTEAVSQGLLPVLGNPATVSRESTFGESRFDLMLGENGDTTYVEVKSVSLLDGGVGLFPDSPTTRGAKHLNTLVEAVRAGHRGSVVFVVQRSDCHAFAVNAPSDPALAEAFRVAVEGGVDAYAYNCIVSEREVKLDRRLPIISFVDIVPGSESAQ